MVGSSVYWVAVMLLLKHLTGSGTVMGLVEMLALLPAFLVGPLAGAVVDTLDRKRIIVGADLVSGLAMIVLAVPGLVRECQLEPISLFGNTLDLSKTRIEVWMIIGVTVCVSLAYALFRPAVDAIVPDLVPAHRLKRVNALFQSNFYITYLIGTSVAGLLYGLVGAAVLILVNGISYLLSAGLESLIEVPARTRDSPPGTPREWYVRTREGVAYLWRHRGLRGMILAFMGTNALFPPVVLSLPFFVEDDLGLAPAWFGHILAAYLAGGILGFLGFGLLKLSGTRNAQVFLGAFHACALLMGILSVSSSIPLVLGLFALVSVNVAIINLLAQTIVQTVVPSSMRGRVFGTMNALTTGLMPISYAVSGVLFDTIGQNARRMFLGVALLCFCAALALTSSRAVRTLVTRATEGKSNAEEVEDVVTGGGCR